MCALHSLVLCSVFFFFSLYGQLSVIMSFWLHAMSQ
ncbi:hypothetical protein OIU79_028186 [Salix purpurea]|uniref:Uncharacterized protein n=1 Tax=Salix purpurea TaxID=77065 RepID=A0A9Q0VXY5_SALPP|nr:hypothetical protein OIU79_028186 [Salix purpurea]